MTNMVQELQRLTAHGVIGLYRSFEITEILGFLQGQPHTQPPVNFLSLAVAEPDDSPVGEIREMPFLNQNRLVLSGTVATVSKRF
ncbi:hypothetical protein [Polaromonas naphthalenivorans]|uniref:hypothetical protein n=1 Tax=Polaromonas naphthalenivorans TaxID=216465 RepID=UPI00059E1514|nr:hypothetical protein [Polaromonas naphthalenivorans]